MSSKGQIVLPAEVRRQDQVEAGQEFNIERLEQWFDEGVRRLHCPPWEAETGLRWADLLARLRTSGRAMPIKDSLIAATALANQLTVATRNVTDFEKAGCEVVNPFEG